MPKFNFALAKATYRQWAAEGDPIRTAVRSLYVPGTKKFKFKADDEDYMTVTITDSQYEVNLPMMQAVLGAGVFHDPAWFSKCEKGILLHFGHRLCLIALLYHIRQWDGSFD